MKSKDIVYVNGNFVPRAEACISVEDRGFVFGDETGPEIRFGDEPENPRQRWRGSLPGHRRTEKK